MLIKSELLKLDADQRAFLLVGAYIGHFALLEAGLNQAIKEVLNLSIAAGLIVTRNMSFYDKVKALKSLVNFFIADKIQAKEFEAAASKAHQIGEERNIIAHTPFGGSKTSDGVVFFETRATKELELKDLDWSIDEFIAKIENIRQVDNRLRQIEQSISLLRIAEALTKFPQSSLGELFGLFTSFTDNPHEPEKSRLDKGLLGFILEK